MGCKYTYKGKEYTEEEFRELLRKGLEQDYLPKEEKSDKEYMEPASREKAENELESLLANTEEQEELIEQLRQFRASNPDFDDAIFDDLRIPNVSFANQKQVMESIAEEVSRLRYDQKRVSLKEVMSRWRDMLQQVADEAEQYSNHLSNYLNNWDVMEAAVRRYLMKRTGYSLDELEENEAAFEKRNYEEDSSFTTDPKLGMSGRIKRFLSFIPDKTNRHYLQALSEYFPKFKFESYIPFDEVYNNLTAWINGERSDFDELMNKIREVDHPWRDSILERLEGAKDQIKNEFVAVMSKHYVPMVYVLIGSKGKGQPVNFTVNYEGTSAMIADVLKRWNYNLKNSPIAKFENGEYYIDEDIAQKLYYQMFNKLADGKLSPRVLKPEELSKWLENFGIEIPIEMLAGITKSNPFRTDKKSIVYTNLFFQAGSPIIALRDKLINYTGKPRELESVDLLSDGVFSDWAKRFAKHVGDVFGNSTRVGDKVVYAFTNNKYIVNRLRDLRSFDRDAEGNLTKRIDLSQSAYTKYYTWKDIANLKFIYLSLSPLKKLKGRKSGKLNHLGPKDHELIKLNMYFNNAKKIDVGTRKQRRAIFFYPTTSDKTVTVAFEAEARGDIGPDMLLNTMVRAEAERILEFQDEQHNIQSFNPGMFYSIPELNDIQELWTEDHKLIPNYLDHAQLIKDAITKHVSNLVKERLTTWKNLGIGLEHMSSYFKDSMSKEIDLSLPAIASDYEVNYLLANYNMSAMFWGDPALYYKQASKNKLENRVNEDGNLNSYDYVADVQETFINVGKRLAADVAPGYEMNTNGTFRLAIIKDLKLPSKYKAEYIKILKKEGYGSINVADAQEFVTWKEHLDILLWTGKINSKQYRDLENKFSRNLDLSPQELSIVLQPMKPVYVNNYLYGTIFRRVYVKSSAVPLIPQLVKGLQLEKLMNAMKASKVNRLAFESAVKVGGFAEPKAAFDEEGNVLDNIDFGEILNLPREGFRIQQDIPLKLGDKITVGTQERKLLFSHLKDVLPELYNQYVSKYIKDFVESFDNFKKELVTDGKIDIKKVAKILAQEGMDRDYSLNDLKAFRALVGNRFKYPLWSLPSSNRIESLLTSIVDNRVRKQKHKGRSYVLVTEAGFKSMGKDTGILYVGEEREIAPMRKIGDKVIPAKVLAKWNFRDEKGKLLPYPESASDIPKELLQLFGFRIPTQGHNSMAVMEIIGFLPPDSPEMIVAPKEFVEQMGSDFDIDKLYVYEPKSANLKKEESEIFDIHWKVMTHPKTFSKIITPLDNGNLKELADEVTPPASRFFSPFSSEYQKVQYINATAGKSGVGVFSMTSVFHAMLQNEGIRIKMPTIEINGYKFDGNLSKVFDFIGNLISDNISHIQSVSVDNQKEQILDKININKHTFGVANFMYLAGFPEDTIVYFLSQPIIRDYVSKSFDNDSILEKSRAAILIQQEVLEKYPAEDVMIPITNANMKNFIKDSSTPLFNEGQRTILMQFFMMEEANEHIRSAMYTLNTDSQGLGKNFSATSTKLQSLVNLPGSAIKGIERLVGEYSYTPKEGFIDTGKMASVFRNGVLVTLPVYIKPTTVVGAASVNSLVATSKYFQELYPYEHPVVDNLFHEIIVDVLGATEPLEKEVLKSQIFEAIKAFIYGTKVVRRKELIDGTLAKRVQQIQKASKKTSWAHNLFLHRLIPNIDKRGISLIEFNASQADGMDTDYLNLAIEELREKRELLPGYSGEQFIQDLFDYSLIIGGRQQANEFIKYLPLDLWDKLRLHEFEFTDEFFGYNILELSSFGRQFIQHNENLLPQFSSEDGKTPPLLKIEAPGKYISYNNEPYERINDTTFSLMGSKGDYKYLEYGQVAVDNNQKDYRPGVAVESLPQTQVDLEEYAKNIQYTSQDPMLREYASQLPIDVPILIDYELDAKGRTTYKGGIEVRINPIHHSSRTDLDITILHEITHAYTKKLIVDYRAGRLSGEALEKMKKLDGLYKLFRQKMINKYGLEGYNKIIQEAKQGLDLERAGKNLEEFVAIATTSRKMQDFMDNELYTGNKSWLKHLWETLTNLFKTKIPKLSSHIIQTVLELGSSNSTEGTADFNPKKSQYPILEEMLTTRKDRAEAEIVKAKEEFKRTKDPEVLRRVDVQEERLRKIVKKIEEASKYRRLEQAIGYIKDRVADISKELESPHLTLDYLISANNELKIFSKMGDFSKGEEHLLLSDLEKASPVVRDQFRILRNISEEVQEKINVYLDNYLANWVNTQLGTDLTVEQVKQAMKDINSWRKFGYDLSRIPDSLAQATHIQMKKARFDAQKDIAEIVETVDELYSKIHPSLRKYLFQKDSDGLDTGRVTHYFSDEFFRAEEKVWENFQNKRDRTSYEAAVKWVEDNQIRFDMNLFFPENGKVDQAALDKHIEELKYHLGEPLFNKYLERLEEKIEEYRAKKQVAIDRINLDPNIEDKESEIDLWIKRNSPYLIGKPVFHNGNRVANKGYAYTYSLPRRYYKSGKLTGWYDENYLEIESRPELQEFHEYLLEQLYTLNSLVPESQRQGLTSIPFFKKSFIELFSKNETRLGAFPYLYDSFMDLLKTEEPSNKDTEDRNPITGLRRSTAELKMPNKKAEIEKLVKIELYQYKAENGAFPDAAEEKRIRRKVIHKITQEQSTDLGKVLKLHAMHVYNYHHASKIEDILNLAVETMAQRKEIDLNKAGIPLVKENGKNAEVDGLKNVNDVMQYAVDVFLGSPMYDLEKVTRIRLRNSKESALYNRKKKIAKSENLSEDEKADLLSDKEGGNVVLSHIGDTLLKYIQLKGMGYNLPGAISNVAFGTISNMRMGADGRLFQMKHMGMAYSMVLHSILKNATFNYVETPVARKLRNIMDKYDFAKDVSNEFYKASRKSPISRRLRWLTPYQLQKRTEYINQSTLILSVMLHDTLRDYGYDSDLTLWEAFNEQGDMSFDMTEFKIKGDQLIKVIHGNYDSDSPILGKKTISGRSVLQFKTWGLEGFANAWEDEKHDYSLGIDLKGRYRTSVFGYVRATDEYSGFSNTAYAIKAMLGKAKLSDRFSEVDAANIRASIVDLIITASLFATLALLAAGDDKKRGFLINLLINQLTRMQSDMFNFISPGTMGNTISNAVPITSLIDDFIGWFAALGDVMDGKGTYKSGPNKKRNKLTVATTKLVPFGSQVEKLRRLKDK